MKTSTSLFALASAIILAMTTPVLADTDPTDDFDFWHGEWTVTVQAALPDGSWRTAEGTSTALEIVGGNAHTESLDTGEYRSQGVRAFDVATGLWNYTMFDNLQMKGLKIWKGKFEEGVGTFEATLPLPTGATAETRIVIDEIENDSFEWRFEMSMDGENWQTAMKMNYRRNP